MASSASMKISRSTVWPALSRADIYFAGGAADGSDFDSMAGMQNESHLAG